MKANLCDFLQQAGGKLPFGAAVSVLAPILYQLAELHDRGTAYLQISPDTIQVDKEGRAFLLPAAKKNAQTTLYPGFAAPEQYVGADKVGPWTDVYGFGATLYFLTTGRRPLGVLQRALDDSAVGEALGAEPLDDAQRALIVSCIALAEGQRPQNAYEVMKKLDIQMSVAFAPQHSVVERERKTKGGRKTAVIVLCAVGALLLLGFFGSWIYIDAQYKKTSKLTDQKQFEQAYAHWAKVPDFYRDSAALGKYLCANIEIGYGNFKLAKQRFEDLGNYRDSADMMREVDYQQAIYFLDRKEFGKARAVFLSLGGYKDSRDMKLEVDYRQALEYYGGKEYQKATDLLAGLKKAEYKDAQDQLFNVECSWADLLFDKAEYSRALAKLRGSTYEQKDKQVEGMIGRIYNKGKELYKGSKYDDAKGCFELLDSYLDSEKYVLRATAHNPSAYNQNDLRALYDELKKDVDFEDTADLLVSDDFIMYWLEGYWSTGSGNTFSMKHTDGGWNSISTFPTYTGSFDIEHGIMSVDGKRTFKFTFLTYDEMNLYCYRNDKTYYLSRR